MNGRIIWITGLSGAGKTSLAVELAERLRRSGRPVVVLDGDALRRVWNDGLSSAPDYGREARLDLALRYARLAELVAAQEIDVVVATISLFKEVHAWNRLHLPEYFEVYLRVPLNELRRRDPKSIYRGYDAGETKNVAGLDLAVDEPGAPDLLLDFAPDRTVDKMADELMRRLDRK